MSVVTPFRHNIEEKREQLGSLDSPTYYTTEYYCFAHTCSMILSHSQGCDIIFIGRSPELMYQFMRGAFHSNKYIQQRVQMLHFSMRNVSLKDIPPENIKSMKEYLTSMNLSPDTIIRRHRPAALIDFIYSGSTFDNFFNLLYTWSKELKVDWNAVRRKILVMTIECFKFTREGFDFDNWVELLGGLSCITRIFIKDRYWDGMANLIPQSFNSYSWQLWGKEDAKEIAHPYHSEERVDGLQLAIKFFDFANSKRGKAFFISQLTQHTFAMRFSWYRSLIHALKGKQPPKIHDNIHQINLHKQSRTVAPRGVVAGADPKSLKKKSKVHYIRHELTMA